MHLQPLQCNRHFGSVQYPRLTTALNGCHHRSLQISFQQKINTVVRFFQGFQQRIATRFGQPFCLPNINHHIALLLSEALQSHQHITHLIDTNISVFNRFKQMKIRMIATLYQQATFALMARLIAVFILAKQPMGKMANQYLTAQTRFGFEQ